MKVTELFEKYLKETARIGVSDKFGNTLYIGTVSNAPQFVWGGRTVKSICHNTYDGSLWLTVSDRIKHC